MACQGSPTATEFTTITSVGVTTSLSALISSLPNSVSTSTLVSCSTSGNNSSICVSNPLVATIPGGLTTIQVPITVSAPVIVEQPTQTLFAPCENSETSSVSSSTSFAISQSTPPPTIITSQSSATRQDGSVTIQWITVTSTLPPTPVWVPTALSTTQPGHSGTSRSVNLAPIIGGALGGFFGLIGLVGLLWLCLRRRPSWGDIFEENDQYGPETIRNTRDRKRRFELDMDAQPKPYQYGLVGQVNSPTLNSPPGSPTSTLLPPGAQPPSLHGRQRSSLTPLLVPSAVSSPGPSMPATASSRPSTAGSMMLGRPPSRPSTTSSMYPMRPPSQHGHYPSTTKSTADEFGIRPMSAPSHSQNSSGWSKKASSSSPPPLVNLSMMNEPTRPNEADGRGGSPVSFQEPRRPLQIVNAQISPTGSVSSSAEILQQPNEVGTPKLGSPLGPKGGKPRTPVNKKTMDPEVIITAPSAPPSYEA